MLVGFSKFQETSRKANIFSEFIFMSLRLGFCSASYGVYISQLIRFARVSSHVDDFNTRNMILTAKLLRQGYRYHKLRKAFSKFYRRHFDIVSKYNVGLKTLLLQGLSKPEFYGDLVYKFRKIIGKNDFPYHFKKVIVRYKKIGYNIKCYATDGMLGC